MSDKEQFEELVALGKQRGVLTYDEINDALPAEFFSPEEMEELMELLQVMGIKIEFDFISHANDALTKYSLVKNRYEKLARKIEAVLREIVQSRGIKILSVTSRAKDEESFYNKAKKPNPDNPAKPYYPEPLTNITDLAGIRLITYFLETLSLLENIIESEFEVIEKSDRKKQLIKDDKFGYQSIHYLVKLSEPRASLPEYLNFKETIFEIQIRTILQHAWAEIEHDIKYKTSADIPDEIRRRFLNLAGLIEIGDREFQFLQDEDRRIKEEQDNDIKSGNIEKIEITGETLKYLLDEMLGIDSRLSDWSYLFASRVVKSMGITNLKELKEIIDSTDIESMRDKLWKWRPGPTTVLEFILLCYFKEEYILKHPLSQKDYAESLKKQWRASLEVMFGKNE